MDFTRFEAWLFDLDGTLVDSMSGVVACMKVTAREVGGEVTDEAVLRASFGRGLMNTLQPWIPEERLDEALERYQKNFPKYVKSTVDWLPWAKEMLDRVKGLDVPMGIVTGNKEFEAKGLFEALGLEKYFEFKNVVCADSIPFQKPRPEPVIEAMRRLGLLPVATPTPSPNPYPLKGAGERLLSDGRNGHKYPNVVFIGDSEHDIRAGQLAGVSTVAVLGGSSTRERLLAVGPDEVVEDLGVLVKRLED